MNENELLLSHAARWAAERDRTFDPELVDLALSLRSVHDGLPANRWPAHSVQHLMLVRWPAHGPDVCPDVPLLVASLDTFWRFLRSSGRMAGKSAEPTDLLREAKTAAKRMPAACADESNYSASKSLMAFGREIGITMDNLADVDEVNTRLQQIVEAWNALPDEERMSRTADAGYAGSRMGGALTKAAGAVQDTGALPPGWTLPMPARLDDEGEGEDLFASDPADSAPHIQGSGFVRQVLALAEWVGKGREVTSTGVLRPAVAREAYRDLGLWEWERSWLRAQGADVPEDPEADAALAEASLRSWRTAADCLALDRLWLPAAVSGTVVLDRRRAVRGREGEPLDPMGWVKLGLLLMAGLAECTARELRLTPLVTVLLSLSEQYGEPSTVANLREIWWSSDANELATALPDSPQARTVSDRVLGGCLAMFGDCGLWVRRRGKLVGTPFGWDVALFFVAMADENGWDDEPTD